MPRPVQIACLQTRPMPDFRSALAEAVDLGERAVAAGAEFLALPEYCGGLKTQGSSFLPPSAPEETHPVLTGLREFCKSKRVWVAVGSLAVETAGGKIANRGFILNDQGMIVTRYDKIHMFDIQLADGEVYRESDTIEPGREAQLVETPFGTIGLAICYDLRFPQLYRELAQAGAEILMTPAAFTKKTGEAHWHVLNRARAIENGAFVVSACAIGPVVGGGESYGHSLIVNPWGEVLADAGEMPGIVLSGINLDEVAEARTKIPSLQHGKPFRLSHHTNKAAE